MHDETTYDPGQRGRRAVADPSRGVTVTILHHPDPARVGDMATDALDARVGLRLSRGEPAFVGPDGRECSLATPGVSRSALEVVSTPEGVKLWPGRPTLSYTVDGAQGRGGELVSQEQLARGLAIGLNDRVLLWIEGGMRAIEPRERFGLVGVSPAMAQLRERIEALADGKAPVLVRGPTGAGKERVATALHGSGARSKAPFISVNAAAIPETTAVSQLFGHARGAFTGAVGASRGYFGDAHGGTLFLDEIGDVPLDLQPMLLRALDTGEIQPVGGAASQVDVRVIAATDVDLERLSAEGRFRDSLYHRLAQRRIAVAPLCTRPADIALLWNHFVRLALQATGSEACLVPPDGPDDPWMGIEVTEALLAYSWPGNVRELQAKAQAFAEQHARSARATVPEGLTTPQDAPSATTPAPAPSARADLASLTSEAVLQALDAHGWGIMPTAEHLGISRNSLRKVMAREGIRRASELSQDEIAAALSKASGDVDAAASALRVGAHALRMRLSEG